MAKSRSITTTLPPRHGGYRAVSGWAKKSAAAKGKALPTPPSGKGGGSKVVKVVVEVEKGLAK